MHLEKVTESNVDYAVSIQEELFPGESGRANYEEALNQSADYKYYLIYHAGDCVGIIGLYYYMEDPDSAWLGWFGIRKEYRRRHLGSMALKLFEEMAAEGGYKYARLYTDAEDNDDAIAFYEAEGYISEPYENANDSVSMKQKNLIFTKPLGDNELVLWNNRNIHLTEQIAKQEKYNQHRSDPGL